MQVVDSNTLYSSIAAAGGGFFAGALIAFDLKKVLKILAIVVGLFFAGLAYHTIPSCSSLGSGAAKSAPGTSCPSCHSKSFCNAYHVSISPSEQAQDMMNSSVSKCNRLKGV